MQNARLDEAQAGIKTARRNINNLRYTDDTTHMADGKTMETVRDFILGVSKITADGDCRTAATKLKDACSLGNLKMLAPWKKSYDKPRQSIKKQRHYFGNNGPPSQSCFFQ